MEIKATAESVEQAKDLLDVGVDTLYVGNEAFGLRLPTSFSLKELKEIAEIAHKDGKKVCVAVNALMHNEHIEIIIPYLKKLHEFKVDKITVGDPGVIHLLKKEELDLPFIYDAQTIVTSARQVNFWAKRGAVGAVLSRELTFIELKQMREQVKIPIEVLVYGATCIHHSKRPLAENYFNFTNQAESVSRERGLFLAESKKLGTHYSVYEDAQGTHIFATDDINLGLYLNDLAEAELTSWKLDGIYTRGKDFVEIVKLFVEAKNIINSRNWSEQFAEDFNKKVCKLHPQKRTLNEGFFLKHPSEVQ
ncbi:peptidase U32 family protein [Pseudogracilibacillus sp. SO30301A]|uniref:peptidase U32 family protein n=1 Tax=Pseudogracilibacillus sp. SO30301A TaxID=3098291 RepID=UPI00300E31EF